MKSKILDLALASSMLATSGTAASVPKRERHVKNWFSDKEWAKRQSRIKMQKESRKRNRNK